jgi:Baculovirus F protein
VSHDRRKFKVMDAGEWSLCQGSTIKLCNPRRQVQDYPERNCLYALFMGNMAAARGLCEYRVIRNPGSVFYSSRSNSHWVFSVASEKIINVQCLSQTMGVGADVTSIKKIIGVGVIRLGRNCYAYAEGNIWLPHYNAATDMGDWSHAFLFPAVTTTHWDMELPVVVNQSVAHSDPVWAEVDKLLDSTVGLQPKDAGIP